MKFAGLALVFCTTRTRKVSFRFSLPYSILDLLSRALFLSISVSPSLFLRYLVSLRAACLLFVTLLDGEAAARFKVILNIRLSLCGYSIMVLCSVKMHVSIPHNPLARPSSCAINRDNTEVIIVMNA